MEKLDVIEKFGDKEIDVCYTVNGKSDWRVMIVNALQNGSNPEDIAKVMNISLEEIREVEKEMK